MFSGGCPKNSATAFCIWGIRVAPPTITTPSISAAVKPASRNAFLIGPSVLPTSVLVMEVNVWAVSVAAIVSPDAKFARMGAEACVVRFSLASRAFIMSSRVSDVETGATPVVSTSQQ